MSNCCDCVVSNWLTWVVIVFIVYVVLCRLQDIELSEALCGFKRVIKTLDKRGLVLLSPAGDVIKHGGFVGLGNVRGVLGSGRSSRDWAES